MKYFETIKCNDHEIFNISWHQKRIAKTIGLNINLQEYIYPPSNELLKCKVIYNKNGILDINFSKYTPRNINSFKIITENHIEYNCKYLKRDNIDKLFSQKENATEIIIVKNNLITDTSIANIAIFIDNHWVTPKKPLLYGTCRDRLLEDNTILEKDITIDQLKNAKQIALMNAMIDFKIIQDFKILN